MWPLALVLRPHYFYMAEVTIDVQSTSDLQTKHVIVINTETKTVHCSCIGFRTNGRCKHIRFYKALIKSFIHEKPGFCMEKTGTQGRLA